MGKGAAGGGGDLLGGLFGGGAGDVSGAGGDLLGGLGGGDPFSGMGGGLGDLTGGLGGGGFGDMFGSGMGDMSLLGGGTFGGLDTGNLTGAPSATNLGGQIQGQGLFNQAQGSPVTQGGQTFAGGGSVGPPETGISDDLKQALGVPPAGPTGLGGPSAPYQASGPGMSLGGQTQAPIPSGAQSLTGNIPGSVAEPGGTPAFGGVTPFNAQSVQGMVNPATGNPAIAGTTLAGGNYGAVPSGAQALPDVAAADTGGGAGGAVPFVPGTQAAALQQGALPAATPAADVTASSPAVATNQAAANVTASQAATNGITQGLSQAGLPQQVIRMLGSLFSGLGGHNNPMGALGQMMGMLGGRGARGSPQSQQGIAQVLTQLTRMGMPQQVVAMIGDLLSALSSHGNPTQLLQQLMQMLQGQGGQQQSAASPSGGNGDSGLTPGSAPGSYQI